MGNYELHYLSNIFSNVTRKNILSKDVNYYLKEGIISFDFNAIDFMMAGGRFCKSGYASFDLLNQSIKIEEYHYPSNSNITNTHYFIDFSHYLDLGVLLYKKKSHNSDNSDNIKFAVTDNISSEEDIIDENDSKNIMNTLPSLIHKFKVSVEENIKTREDNIQERSLLSTDDDLDIIDENGMERKDMPTEVSSNRQADFDDEHAIKVYTSFLSSLSTIVENNPLYQNNNSIKEKTISNN